MNLRNLFKPRKKFITANDPQSVSSTALFAGFGNFGYFFKDVYKTQQNNNLLIDYFNNIAEVAAPILKYSDGAGLVKFTCTIPEVEKLLLNPNYYQGWDDFFSTTILYKRLLGNGIINAFSALGVDGTTKPKYLFIFSPQFTSIEVKNTTDFRQNEIVRYVYDTGEVNRKPIFSTPENILHLKETNPNVLNNQYLFGEGRYCGCGKNIESISNGYGAKVNLYKNGPRLIITGDGLSEFSAINVKENIEAVQERMKKYGWGKNEYNNLITDLPLKVFNASLNVQQLQINPNNQADFQRLCDAQGIDSKIFSDSTSSTYNNKEQALLDFYNNPFKSEIESTFNDLENWLKTWWPRLKLKPDFSNISYIQKANIDENKRIFEDVKAGIRTRNEYLESSGEDRIKDPEFDKLYTYNPINASWNPVIVEEVETGISQEQASAQANLRGTASGVESILNVQNSVATGITDYDSGVAILVEIYGFTDATARRVLGNPDKINQNENTEQNQRTGNTEQVEEGSE